MTQYHSKPVSEHGHIDWDQDEHAVWHELITRQQEVVKTRACQAYLDGLNMLNLPTDRLPQLPEINRVLQRETGWQVEPVPALISFDRFFALLADKKFPVATLRSFQWPRFCGVERSLIISKSRISSMKCMVTALCSRTLILPLLLMFMAS